MERKTLTIELKADQPGHLEAVFSRFNVVDHDGDVTLPDAFEAGATVRLLPAHDWAHYAIGKGVIRVDPDKAIFEGDFNLKTTAGKDWYESVKDLQDLQEFSYGFDVLEAEPGTVGGQPVRILKRLQVHEVSPVTLGAGIGTGVLAIKDRSDPPTEAEVRAYMDVHPEFLKTAFELLMSEPDPDPDDDQKAAALADALTAFQAELKEGRTFSTANVGRLSGIADELAGAAEKLRALIAASEAAEKGRAPEAVVQAVRAFLASERYYEGVLR